MHNPFDFLFELGIILGLTGMLVVTPLMTAYVRKHPDRIIGLSRLTNTVQTMIGLIFMAPVLLLTLSRVMDGKLRDYEDIVYIILLGMMVFGTMAWSYLSIRHMNCIRDIYLAGLDRFDKQSPIAPYKEEIANTTFRSVVPCWTTIVVPPIPYLIGCLDFSEYIQTYFMVIFAASAAGTVYGTCTRTLSETDILKSYLDALYLDTEEDGSN